MMDKHDPPENILIKELSTRGPDEPPGLFNFLDLLKMDVAQYNFSLGLAHGNFVAHTKNHTQLA